MRSLPILLLVLNIAGRLYIEIIKLRFRLILGSSLAVLPGASSSSSMQHPRRDQTLWREKGLVIEGTCNQRRSGLETSFLLLRHCFFAPSKHHHLCSSLASYSKTLSNCTSSAKSALFLSPFDLRSGTRISSRRTQQVQVFSVFFGGRCARILWRYCATLALLLFMSPSI